MSDILAEGHRILTAIVLVYGAIFSYSV